MRIKLGEREWHPSKRASCKMKLYNYEPHNMKFLPNENALKNLSSFGRESKW